MVDLSEARFRDFLDAREGDHIRAVRLYNWNAEACGTLLEVFHHVEVLLRNAIDHQFPATEPHRPISILRPGIWLTDPEIVKDQGREGVNDVIARVWNDGRTPTRGTW